MHTWHAKLRYFDWDGQFTSSLEKQHDDPHNKHPLRATLSWNISLASWNNLLVLRVVTGEHVCVFSYVCVFSNECTLAQWNPQKKARKGSPLCVDKHITSHQFKQNIYLTEILSGEREYCGTWGGEGRRWVERFSEVERVEECPGENTGSFCMCVSRRSEM